MALRPISHNNSVPYQFDCLDADLGLRGGEVLGLTYVSTAAGTDAHASDVNDGYTSNTRLTRPALTKTLVSGMRPLFLSDDGTTGYGTMFGSVVGASAGSSQSETVVGPNTTRGSGKATVWQTPGIFAVSLDAVDTTSTTGLQPTNTSILGNAALYATTAGLLTPNVAAAFESVVVGRFLEFTTNGSLVTTPSYLTSALNSPTGNVVNAAGLFTHALFRFTPPQG